MSDEFDTVMMSNLLGRARGGEAGAWDDLLRRCGARLDHLARKMLRDYPAVRRWEDTDDVLQNATLRLLRALKAVEPGSTREFFALAAEQIRRELIDLSRRYRSRPGPARPAPGVADDTWVQEAADPADGSADLDRWAAFHEAVEKLPAEEREVVMLAFYHGWTQAQIAELFGLDERTIRRRWKSAGDRLREALGGELPAPGD